MWTSAGHAFSAASAMKLAVRYAAARAGAASHWTADGASVHPTNAPAERPTAALVMALAAWRIGRRGRVTTRLGLQEGRVSEGRTSKGARAAAREGGHGDRERDFPERVFQRSDVCRSKLVCRNDETGSCKALGLRAGGDARTVAFG